MHIYWDCKFTITYTYVSESMLPISFVLLIECLDKKIGIVRIKAGLFHFNHSISSYPIHSFPIQYIQSCYDKLFLGNFTGMLHSGIMFKFGPKPDIEKYNK
ncbi:hypothetical protein BpHYR1_017180 [Brachionus plicatilis]|uniref:Uncharacterized protein n=1 Tax=Brachionus plicatilis TaxID=10195 RepID=A0A3M7R036_BRAPC|nr:hypothetical protein BpHYR1_017180 [Brachionus plicatilis]